MATTPTQLPVPSEKPQDLKFNAGKIDEFVTSMGWTYTDRFGQNHYTIEGINYLAQQVMSAFGYVTLTGLTFTTGATISNPNEVLFNTADNSYYKWTGSFTSGPKIVPANSTPESTGGIGPGKWLSVGDTVLRSDLAGEDGATFVHNGGETVAVQLDRLLTNDSSVFHVDNYGAIGDGALSADQKSITGTDDTAAFIAAIAAAKAAGGGKVIASSNKTYLLTYTLLYPSNFVFDGQGCSLLWNPKNNDASLALPETFQISDNTTYTTDVIWRNFTYKQIRNDTTPVNGNMLGVMKARRVILEDVYVPYIYWHIFDGAGGKDCVVRRINCGSCSTSAVQFDSSGNGNNAAVYGIDASGARLMCASSPAGVYDVFTYSENCFAYDNVINSCLFSGFHIHGGGCRSIFIHGNKVNNSFCLVRSDANTSHNEIHITGNISGNNTWGMYLMAQHTNIIINSNIIYRADATNFAVVMNDAATTLKNGLVFTGNRIVGYGRGIHVQNYNGVVISGNSCYNTGSGLPTGASGLIGSAVGCFVVVDCGQIAINNNSSYGCNVNACVIVKGTIDNSPIGPAVISGNVSSSSGAAVLVRAVLNPVVTNNSARMLPGSFLGIAEVFCVDSSISGNSVQMPDGQSGIYCQGGTSTSVGNNNIHGLFSTGYGIQLSSEASSRSFMNNVTGFTAASQIYLDGTTGSGRHCEPFATLGKAASASGTNYTPSGTAM